MNPENEIKYKKYCKESEELDRIFEIKMQEINGSLRSHDDKPIKMRFEKTEHFVFLIDQYKLSKEEFIKLIEDESIKAIHTLDGKDYEGTISVIKKT